MHEDFSGKKWEVTVQTQAEAARSQVTAKVDAAAIREHEDRQKVLNALSERGGKEGITLSKLMPYTGMRRPAVERHLAALFAFEERRDLRRVSVVAALEKFVLEPGVNLSEIIPLLSRSMWDIVSCTLSSCPYLIGWDEGHT